MPRLGAAPPLRSRPCDSRPSRDASDLAAARDEIDETDDLASEFRDECDALDFRWLPQPVPVLAHLEELDVQPAHGRQGLGTARVHAVCDWASFGSSGWIRTFSARGAAERWNELEPATLRSTD